MVTSPMQAGHCTLCTVQGTPAGGRTMWTLVVTGGDLSCSKPSSHIMTRIEIIDSRRERKFHCTDDTDWIPKTLTLSL